MDIQSKDIVRMAKAKRHIFLLNKLKTKPSLSRSEIKELEKFEGGKLPPGFVDSQDRIAYHFGVAQRTVSRWVKEDMPIRPDGLYCLADIQVWRHRKTIKKSSKEKSNQPTAEDWDLEYRKNKALLAEIQLKKERKELIPFYEVEQDNIRKIQEIKTKFLSLPRYIAAQLVGLSVRDIEAKLRDRIEEVIDGFARGETKEYGRKTKRRRKK